MERTSGLAEVPQSVEEYPVLPGGFLSQFVPREARYLSAHSAMVGP
jgi:hypothetical protein